jgi:hypothetical protein
MLPHPSDIAKKTFVVTVTYGDRFKYLNRVIRGSIDNQVGRVIVVDNASSTHTIENLRKTDYYSRGIIDVLTHQANLG